MNHEINEIDLARADLNLLVALAALHHTRSVKGAAARLALTPSAVSMALGRLRHLFGDELFVRGRGGMIPTARAEALYARVAPALFEIRRAIAGADVFDPRRAELVLRVGVSDDLAPGIVPGLVHRVRTNAPRTRLVVRPASLVDGSGALDRGEVDVALVTGEVEPSRRILQQPLADEMFHVLFDRRAMGWTGRLTLARYLAAEHVIVSSSGRLSGRTDDALARIGRRREVGLALGQYATLPEVLRGRPLMAEVPRLAAPALAKRHRLATAPLPFETAGFPITLAWHRRDDADPPITWLRGELAGIVARMVSAR